MGKRVAVYGDLMMVGIDPQSQFSDNSAIDGYASLSDNFFGLASGGNPCLGEYLLKSLFHFRKWSHDGEPRAAVN
jgi:hypothetical protein